MTLFRILFELFGAGVGETVSATIFELKHEAPGYLKRVYGLEAWPSIYCIGRLSYDRETGAFSRATFETFMREQMERTVNRVNEITLILIDTSGCILSEEEHSAQAQRRAVLRSIASWVYGAMPEGDMLFRWSADRLLLLSPNCGANNAECIVNSIRELIGMHMLREEIGCRFFETRIGAQERFEELIDRLDHAVMADDKTIQENE